MFEPGNLVQICASRCKGNGRINSHDPIRGWRPGIPLPVSERYYSARLAKHDVKSNNPFADTVKIACTEIGIYISEHRECPNLDAWPDYYNITKMTGKLHIVHKVLFPEIGFLYIENNFLKRVG